VKDSPTSSVPSNPPQKEAAQTRSLFQRILTPPLRKWTIVGVVLLLGSAGFCVLPAYRGVIKWRAISLAAKAMDAAGKQKMELAFSLVRSAYQLRPMEPQVLRSVARICDLRGDPLAQRFWQILTSLPEATQEDRQSYVQSALDWQVPDPKINDQLQWLLKSNPRNATLWLLLARWLEFGGNLAQSQNAARQALALNPGNEEAALFLGKRLFMKTATHQEGLQLLEPLIAKPDRIGLEATLLLAQQQEIAPNQIDLLKERLQNDPLGNVSHRLAALELALRKNPTRADELITDAMEHYRKAGGADLAEFGSWLNNHGVPSLVLRAIPRETALGDHKLLLIYLDALAMQKNWKEVESTVESPGVPLDKSVVELFIARCAQEMGENERASEHWRAAQSAALGNPEQAFYVAKYARQCGRTAQAQSIYRSLTINGTTARAAYVEMMSMAARQGTRELRGVLKEVLVRWPSDETAQNDYSYCSLLLGEEIDKSRVSALELVKKSPGVIAFRTTLALAWLRSGKPKEALDVYRGLEIDWLSAPASFRAIAAAVSWANGQKAEARKMAGTFRVEDLKIEEQTLVRFSDD